jgi:hypothetical protein
MTVTLQGALPDSGIGNCTLVLCGGKVIYGDAASGFLRITQFVNNNWCVFYILFHFIYFILLYFILLSF